MLKSWAFQLAELRAVESASGRWRGFGSKPGNEWEIVQFVSAELISVGRWEKADNALELTVPTNVCTYLYTC